MCILLQYVYTFPDRIGRAEHNYVVIIVRYTVSCKLWGSIKMLYIYYGEFSGVKVAQNPPWDFLIVNFSRGRTPGPPFRLGFLCFFIHNSSPPKLAQPSVLSFIALMVESPEPCPISCVSVYSKSQETAWIHKIHTYMNVETIQIIAGKSEFKILLCPLSVRQNEKWF